MAPPLSRHLIRAGNGLSVRALSTSIQKLERIANDLLSLNQLERHDYSILLGHKMGPSAGPRAHKYSLLFKHNMGLNRHGPELPMGPSREDQSD